MSSSMTVDNRLGYINGGVAGVGSREGSQRGVRDHIQNRLRLVLGTVSTKSNVICCDCALSTEGGHYSVLLPVTIRHERFNSWLKVALMAFRKGFQFSDRDIPANHEN